MASDVDPPATGPFEGPEKLLEIWFQPSPADVPGASTSIDGKFGLRRVSRDVWADMLDIVQCKILSVVEGTEMDAYLLSESSFFVSPHRIILKTCGTTLNLLGVPRILEIARDHASLPSVHQCFYSRKTFMFPERQLGPHRDWLAEIEFLDSIFPNGAAYTIGKVNGDHWLLYITTPGDDGLKTTSGSPIENLKTLPDVESCEPVLKLPESGSADAVEQDYTIEILMTHLAPAACRPFIYDHSDASEIRPSEHASALSSELGVSELFPPDVTTLDGYSFTPCGYSCNALIKWRENAGMDPAHSGEGYYTIHVTPEEGWSYASFECNVPLPTSPTEKCSGIPDLKTLIGRVVSIFQPGRLTLTLFISSEDNDTAEEEHGESAVEAAQRAFKAALTLPSSKVVDADSEEAGAAGGFRGIYRRTDKINYEFGGYDLAFATFELRR
ncbi:S-adenosylmethionine decarboxylase [Sparassis latifolia]